MNFTTCAFLEQNNNSKYHTVLHSIEVVCLFFVSFHKTGPKHHIPLPPLKAGKIIFMISRHSINIVLLVSNNGYMLKVR